MVDGVPECAGRGASGRRPLPPGGPRGAFRGLRVPPPRKRILQCRCNGSPLRGRRGLRRPRRRSRTMRPEISLSCQPTRPCIGDGTRCGPRSGVTGQCRKVATSSTWSVPARISFRIAGVGRRAVPWTSSAGYGGTALGSPFGRGLLRSRGAAATYVGTPTGQSPTGGPPSRRPSGPTSGSPAARSRSAGRSAPRVRRRWRQHVAQVVRSVTDANVKARLAA